ncbi:MAG: hypothetical protein AB8G17_03635 [Gammaproteobacteria bacterium]
MKAVNPRNVCLLVAMTWVTAGCEPVGKQANTGAQDPYGPWLDALTEQIGEDRLTDPPSQILSFRYRQQTVFYRPPYCCDIPGVIYDASGAVMCYPTGGLGGNGDGQCDDFFRQRADCALVWRDARAKAKAPDACRQERTNPLLQ